MFILLMALSQVVPPIGRISVPDPGIVEFYVFRNFQPIRTNTGIQLIVIAKDASKIMKVKLVSVKTGEETFFTLKFSDKFDKVSNRYLGIGKGPEWAVGEEVQIYYQVHPKIWIKSKVTKIGALH